MAAQMHSEWLSNPAESHRSWRAPMKLANGRSYAVHTQALYQALFGKFVRWMAVSGVTLANCSPTDLAAFLEGLSSRRSAGQPASARTQRTYVAELDRVFAHLQEIGLRGDNPARPLLGQMKVTTPLKPRAIMFASTELLDAYRRYLREASDLEKRSFEDVRGHAIAALILEMGLTIKEVQKLTLSHVREEAELAQGGVPTGRWLYRVHTPGHRFLQPRSALIEHGTPWMREWLRRRSGVHVVLPAVIKGKRLRAGSARDALGVARELAPTQARLFVSKAGHADGQDGSIRATGMALNSIQARVIHDAVTCVFQIAGASARAGLKSPQTFRNLVAAELINDGLSDREVADRMGFMGLDQVWALKRTALVRPSI